MDKKAMPKVFRQLCSDAGIKDADVLKTGDGFWLIYKSLSDLLAQKGIMDFLDSAGERLACANFFDDWFLYAVPHDGEHVVSLLKLREQEHDAAMGAPADGDTPGVTISFISFDCGVLLRCLEESTDENRKQLDHEINRVVAYRGQSHHNALKWYFKNPRSQGPYLVAAAYTKYIASFAKNGCLAVPEKYKETVQRSISYKNSAKFARLPAFIASLNQKAGYTICDNENIYFQNPEMLTSYEAAAVLATHTGNTSVYSFAAEVEYHARFLTTWAKIRIPFFGRSIYDSAIRADLSVGDTEFEGTAPYRRSNSKIVQRQYMLHCQEATQWGSIQVDIW